MSFPARWIRGHGESSGAKGKTSAAEAVGDTELVQQSLGLEICDPDGCGLAFLDAPVLGDLDGGVAAGEAEIHQRHHALVLGNENVVAEPPEVEDAWQIGQHLIAEEGCSRMHAAPGEIVRRRGREVWMQVRSETGETALYASLVVGVHNSPTLLARGLVAHDTVSRSLW